MFQLQQEEKYQADDHSYLRTYILNNTRALFDLGNKANIINLAYIAELGLLIKKIELEFRNSTALL